MIATNADTPDAALKAACLQAAAAIELSIGSPQLEWVDTTARNLYILATASPWKRGDVEHRGPGGTSDAPARTAPARSVAAALVGEINRLDTPHRKGWKPSDYIGSSSSTTVIHLQQEVAELVEALGAIRDHNGSPEAETEAGDHAAEELADVFACVLQIAYRLGMSFDVLDAEAVRKLRLRFIGADKILIPLEVKIDG